MRFDPESDQYREEAVRALRWGTQADRRNREAILKASPDVLARAMNRLSRRGMGIRRTARGVEWQLWRGEGRCDTDAKFRERNSWAVKPSNADRFAKDAADKHEPCPHVTMAWVPMSAVVSVPKMYGSESKAWGPATPGAFIYRGENEVVIDPFEPGDRRDHLWKRGYKPAKAPKSITDPDERSEWKDPARYEPPLPPDPAFVKVSR